VSIDQLDVINQMRRYLVLSESRFSPKRCSRRSSRSKRKRIALGRSGPAGIARSGPLDSTFRRWPRRWSGAERPDIPVLGRIAWDRFDDRAKKITVRVFARILKACNVDFCPSSDREEHCHGRFRPASHGQTSICIKTLAGGPSHRDARPVRGEDHRHELPRTAFHQMGNEFPQPRRQTTKSIHHSTYIERLLQENRVPLRTAEGKTP